MAGSGHVTRKGWNVSAKEPEANSEVLRNAGTRDNSRSEHIQNRQNDDQPYHNVYDNYLFLTLTSTTAYCITVFSYYKTQLTSYRCTLASK